MSTIFMAGSLHNNPFLESLAQIDGHAIFEPHPVLPHLCQGKSDGCLRLYLDKMKCGLCLSPRGDRLPVRLAPQAKQ